MSRAKGVRAEQIVALGEFLDSPAFDATEKVVLAYATAMTQTPPVVDDRLFARVRQHFDDAQIVELTAAIAWENFRARCNRALDIAADGFAEGTACALPVGPAAALQALPGARPGGGRTPGAA